MKKDNRLAQAGVAVAVLSADLYMSDGNDRASGGGGGAHEAYIVYRHNLSLSAVTGTKLAFGPVRELSLMTGFNWNTKNDAFAARVRELLIGPTEAHF